MEPTVEHGGIKLRSYQQEMLEASTKNIIIAMDTNSGKTHVAIARIRRELERSNASKVGYRSLRSAIILRAFPSDRKTTAHLVHRTLQSPLGATA